MAHLVGIDVGGTFTDFVSYDPKTQAVRVWKSLTTPRDPTEGVLGGLEQEHAVPEVGNIRLGTTIATNARPWDSPAVVHRNTCPSFA